MRMHLFVLTNHVRYYNARLFNIVLKYVGTFSPVNELQLKT